MGYCDGEKCPKCGSTNTDYSNYCKDWHCRNRGHDWE